MAILDGVNEAGRADLFDWVERTAEAESNYWQGFTAKQALVGLVPVTNRRGVGYGRTVSGGGATVMVEVGTDVDRRRLFNDWVLTHELIHTAMPFIRGRGTWFMEGAATYVEPIIRARAGWKTEEEVWHEWVDNMPQGVQAFSAGMANASGRQNYWGGATFMLMADIGIRRASNGAKGLEDCLAGVLWSGIDGTQRMAVADYAAACDRATGTTAMSSLVDRHFAKAEPVDLAALWKDLGISVVGRPHRVRRFSTRRAMAQDDRARQPSAEAGQAAVGKSDAANPRPTAEQLLPPSPCPPPAVLACAR